MGKSLERLGDLATVLVSGSHIALPAINENIRAANISGQRTIDMSIGIGLSILGSILGAMGGSKLGLDTKYNRATSAAFEFQDIYQDSVEVAKVDQFLGDADVSPFSRHVAQLLEADDIFVTTATIKSTQFTLEAKTSDGVALEVSIPENQEVVGGNVKVSGSATVTSRVTYTGNIPLVFGFQAIRLFYDRGHYTAFEPIQAGNVGLRDLSQATSDGTRRFITDSAFVNLVDG